MTFRADILIVTPLALERRAVREHLHHLESVQTKKVSLDLGKYQVDRGSRPTLTVAILEPGPGNVDAALLTQTTLNDLPHVRHVIACGIAGGYKDVRIGDVVASSKVYWIEAGKELDDGFLPRPNMAPVSPLLLQCARQVATDDRWQVRSTLPASTTLRKATPATALVGPMAVIESVVAGRRTETALRVAEAYGDALAVDMEGFGVLKAAAEVSGRAMGIEVRGISDLLGGKTAADAAGSQPYAAAQAAAFTFGLLEVLPQEAGKRDNQWWQRFGDVASRLYPSGLQDRAVWTRSGGDLAAVDLSGPALGQWHDAIRQLRNGGGGSNLSLTSLMTTMLSDHGNDVELVALVTTDDPRGTGA